MRVSGFTFVRNALDLDYPVVESISSVLPAVDELIVNVGDCSDKTPELIESIESPKIRIITSHWDPTIRTGGRALAIQADMALSHCTGDWALYIQADEVLHEDDLPLIHETLARHLSDGRVEGLLFDFLHFYGNYNTVGVGRKWYGREVRVVRNGLGISAWKDAQGFRLNGRKLRVAHSGARIYHYGWVRDPVLMKTKTVEMARLWHDDRVVERRYSSGGSQFRFDTGGRLAPFRGSHPTVMGRRLQSSSLRKAIDPVSNSRASVRHRLLDWFEERLGWSPGRYENYHLLRGGGFGRPETPSRRRESRR